MDAIYQWIVLQTFYPAEAVIVAIALAFFPYVLLRGPITRVARWRIDAAPAGYLDLGGCRPYSAGGPVRQATLVWFRTANRQGPCRDRSHVLETEGGQALDDKGWQVRLLGDRDGETWSGEPIQAEVVRRVPPPIDLALLKLRGNASRSPSDAFTLRLARYDQESDLAGVWFAGFPDAAREREEIAQEALSE